jgi:glutamate-1-semialdehyde 2,1-aminomutase
VVSPRPPQAPDAKGNEVDYRISTTESRKLSERLRRVLPAGDTRSVTYYPPYPLALARGEGCQVWDVDGNRFIDLLNNYTSLVHGHAHPQIAAALIEQVPLGTAFPAPSAGQAELAERIVERVKSVQQLRFTNSGSEAVMQAVKVARAHTGRVEVVKAIGGYHGCWEQVPMTWAAGAGDVPEFVHEIVHMVPFNDLDALEQLMSERGERIAALLFEPVLGEGVIPGDPAFFALARQLADRYGSLLITDEVVSFRLAWGGYQSVLGVEPDLTTFGKIIGGGLPVGAVGGREDVMRHFAPDRSPFVAHSGTFNGNPLTVAAGCASLDLLTADEIDRINALGERLSVELHRLLNGHGLTGPVTVCGSLIHLHLEAADEIRTFDDVNLASEQLARLHLACLDEGVYYAPRGVMNISTVLGEESFSEAVASFERAISRVAEEVALTA